MGRVPALCLLALLILGDSTLGIATTYWGHETPEDNLLGNPEFDNPMPGSANDQWFMNGASSMSSGRTQDGCYSGDWCAYAINRTASWVGPFSRVLPATLEPDTRYWFSAWIKLTQDNRADTTPHIRVNLKYSKKYFTSAQEYPEITNLDHLVVDNEWRYLAGDFVTPDADAMADMERIEFYPDVPNEIGYMLDATGLTKVSDPDWRDTAAENIEQYRKGPFQLRIVTPCGMDASLVQVEINQTKNGYPFGTQMYGESMTDWQLGTSQEDLDEKAYNAKYRTYVADHFNGGVWNHITKWRQMENAAPILDDTKFELNDAALAVTDDMGLWMRGHCLLWNVEEFQPDYIKDLVTANNQTGLLYEMDRRVEYMTEHYQDRFIHYDVSNEHSGVWFFEGATGRRDILTEIFNKTRIGDSKTKLFTNNYNNIESQAHFMTTINNVLTLKRNNLVDGIGAQSHGSSSPPDIPIVKRRMEAIASLGIPIWITEMDSQLTDMTAKVAYFEDMLLLYYGFPQVEGIVFWGVEQFTDDNLQNNALGTAVENLIQVEWRTNMVVTPLSKDFQDGYRGFHGTYNVSVKYNGEEVSSFNFELEKDTAKQIEIVLVDRATT